MKSARYCFEDRKHDGIDCDSVPSERSGRAASQHLNAVDTPMICMTILTALHLWWIVTYYDFNYKRNVNSGQAGYIGLTHLICSTICSLVRTSSARAPCMTSTSLMRCFSASSCTRSVSMRLCLLTTTISLQLPDDIRHINHRQAIDRQASYTAYNPTALT